MRRKIVLFLGTALPILLLVVGIKSGYIQTNTEKISIYSPVPDFLSRTKNNQVSSLSLFMPILQEVFASSKAPNISAEEALVYDLTSQKTLYEKDPKLRHPMASITKIMTAIVALENPLSTNRYVVPKAALVGEDSMGLSEGEVLTLEELLYGLMLPSGNDAAEVLASGYPGGRSAFVKAMNDKAQSLGLKDTNYTNPSGLQGDGDQYTTAHDLLVITNYALSHFPLFNKVIQTIHIDLPYSTNHKEFYLENETNLLTSYPGVKGVKTGYTPEAGLCLVTYLDYKGHKIIGILLGSNNRREEMKELLDYGLKEQGVSAPPHR